MARSTSLSAEDEAIVVAFRRHTLLPLDDCLYALQPTLPHLIRSSLHRSLQRQGEKPDKRKFKSYPLGYFHIDIAEVHTEQGRVVQRSLLSCSNPLMLFRPKPAP